MHRTLAFVLLSLFPSVVSAQVAPDSLAAGTKVRVRVQEGSRLRWVTGEFLSQSRDSIVLGTGAGLVAVSSAEAVAVQRAVGKKSAFWTGAAIGAPIGGVIGAVVASAAHEPCNPEGGFGCPFSSSQAEETLAGGLAGAVLGFLAGGVTGAVVKKTRWEPVVIPGGRIGARVTLR